MAKLAKEDHRVSCCERAVEVMPSDLVYGQWVCCPECGKPETLTDRDLIELILRWLSQFEEDQP